MSEHPRDLEAKGWSPEEDPEVFDYVEDEDGAPLPQDQQPEAVQRRDTLRKWLLHDHEPEVDEFMSDQGLRCVCGRPVADPIHDVDERELTHKDGAELDVESLGDAVDDARKDRWS